MAFVGIVQNQAVAEANDYVIQPSITIAEEFNDNIYEAPSNKVSDFITHLIPGISFKYSASAWDWEGSYFLDYAYYARLGTDNITHTLMTKGLVKVIDEFLFLEISDTYRRASLDVTRDVTQESAFSNQSDQNIFSVSPYLIFRPTAFSRVKTGYRYSNIWYGESAGVDKNQHDIFADATYDLTAKTSLIANYTYTFQTSSLSEMNKHDVLIGVRHEYLDNCFVYGQTGTSYYSFNSGQDSSTFIWNAGLLHTIDSVVMTIDTGVRFAEDPTRNFVKENFYVGKLVKTYGRGQGYFTGYYSKYGTIGGLGGADQTSKLGAGVGVKHELFQNVTGTANFAAEKYDYDGGTYTNRLAADYGVVYLMPYEITAGLSHRYFHYFSPDRVYDNREVNRVMLELRKVF